MVRELKCAKCGEKLCTINEISSKLFTNQCHEEVKNVYYWDARAKLSYDGGGYRANLSQVTCFKCGAIYNIREKGNKTKLVIQK